MHDVRIGAAHIPALGFGTFELDEGTCRDMVSHALDTGYRHIDTAQAYGNEAAVGAAIRDSGIPRDELFVTTKVWVNNFRADDLEPSVDASLDRLGLERVDLLLLHWPSPEGVPMAETLGALNAVRERGKTRHMGVSNFTTGHVRQALELSDGPLVTNQVEYHPFLDQRTVKAELDRQGLSLTAYAPLAQGRVVNDETLAGIGSGHGKSAAQVALRWLIQQPDVIAIPRSSSREHVEANFDVQDFELNDDEMARIGALARPDGRVINPDGLAPDWD